MEAVILAMVVLAPWAFAAVHPISVFVLYAALAVVLVLQAALLVVERRVPAGPCPVAAALAGMVLLGVWQTTPLPPNVLAALAPTTAGLRSDLLPVEPEHLTGEPAGPPAPATISLSPAATRDQVTKLLAVLALFAAVRCAVASTGSFRRLAVAATVNGAVLSLFALVHKFSAPSPHVVYWVFESQGTVFGPFVCRNHFPFYVNACFGLGLGLLLGSPGIRGKRPSLADPTVLWLILALGMMLAATVASLSRGGMLALFTALAVGGITALAVTRKAAGLSAVGAIAAVGLGLVLWFGTGDVGKRLDTLWGGDALKEGRGDVWRRVLPLAARFPVWGTGYGTFESVEPMGRQPGDPGNLSWDHAHNEYLEALVEGGACQLGLMLLAIGSVYWLGVRAYRRARGRPAAGHIIGGLVGFTALAVHGFGDFGLHVPSVAVLAAVLAAQLAAAGSGHPAGQRSWLAVPAAAACVAVAVVLVADGWRDARADRLRLAALRATNRLPPGDRGRVIRYWEGAVVFRPDDVAMRVELAEARYHEYVARRAAPGQGAAELRRLDDELLRPAVRDWLAARRGNPLLSRPHARLAEFRHLLANPDAAVNYLERSCRLEPTDATLWFLAGRERLAAGDPDRAWDHWRRSLLCSRLHLDPVVTSALPRLGQDGLVERVLPAKPDLLAAAADVPAAAAARSLLLARALDLTPPGPADGPEDLYRRAKLYRDVGRGGDAADVLQRAVDRAPDRAAWGYELAELRYRRGELDAARQALRQVLRQDPAHPAAKDLYARVIRDQTRGP
jgi:O-antigen ligase